MNRTAFLAAAGAASLVPLLPVAGAAAEVPAVMMDGAAPPAWAHQFFRLQLRTLARLEGAVSANGVPLIETAAPVKDSVWVCKWATRKTCRDDAGEPFVLYSIRYAGPVPRAWISKTLATGDPRRSFVHVAPVIDEREVIPWTWPFSTVQVRCHADDEARLLAEMRDGEYTPFFFSFVGAEPILFS